MYKRKDGLYEVIKTFDGKRVAFRARTQREVERKIAEYLVNYGKSQTFSSICNNWLKDVESTVREQTYITYIRYAKHWESVFGRHNIGDITIKNVQTEVKRYSLNRSYKTVSNCTSVLNLIFEYAIIRGLAEDNPVQHVQIPKGLKREKRKFPTDNDRQAVFNNRNSSYIGRIFFFALYTGMRRGEIFALKWDDIDFKNKVIHINKSVKWLNNVPIIGQTKTENGVRDTVLLSEVENILVDESREGYVFAVDGKIPHESWITRRVKEYQRDTGIKLTLHEMRHGFATVCFEQGIDPKIVQHLLGHSQISTTLDIYTHFQSQSLLKIRDILNTNLHSEFIE